LLSRYIDTLQDGWLVFDSSQEQLIVLNCAAPRLVLRPIHPPRQWVLGVLSPWGGGLKWPMNEADHSSQSSCRVKNGGAIPPLPDTLSWHGP
jgi:hypothetical protein